MAADTLENIIEPMENCPQTQAAIDEMLHAKGVYQVGEMLVGVVGMGHGQTAGEQRISEYFESFWWTLKHPKAREHGTIHLGGHLVYLENKAEVKRMRIIIDELTVEANRRGIYGY